MILYAGIGLIFSSLVFVWGHTQGRKAAWRDDQLKSRLLDDQIASIARHARNCDSCREHLAVDLWSWLQDLENQSQP